MPNPDDDGRDRVDLATLIQSFLRAEDLTYEELAARTVLPDGEPGSDTGQPVYTRQNLWALATQPRKGFLDRKGFLGLANALRVHVSAVVLANAVSLGLEPPPGGQFATLLPGWVDDLPVGDHMAVRDVILRLGDARGLTA